MRILGFSIVAATTLVMACGRTERQRVVDTSAVVRDSTVVAGEFTLADFRSLRWLAGRWQGFQPDGGKFYEEYRVVNDSTLAMFSYPDSTFGRASDSSRVQLRGKTVSNESLSAQWVATRLDSTGADFVPLRGARNSFTWARESATAWNATLRWNDANGQAQRVVYALHRFGR
jgi:hypothetical protein